MKDNMDLEKLYVIKAELTNKIRESKGSDKEKLIEQSRSINDQIKSLKSGSGVGSSGIDGSSGSVVGSISGGVSGKKPSNKVMKLCKGCNQEYEGNKIESGRVDIVFCKACRKIRGADVIEIITKDLDILYYDNADKASEALKSLTADVRLDLHKTLDTISSDTKLSIESVCCISFVGYFTQTRIDARTDIMDRIKTQQIRFGILVFKRGSKKDPLGCERFHEIGSKAWVNNILGSDTDKVLFVDDSDDHVYSVQSINSKIKSIKIRNGDDLLSLIQKHYLF